MMSLNLPEPLRTVRTGSIAVVLLVATAGPVAAQVCNRTVTADVVAFDQPIFYNRLGAFDPAGMIYALRRDVVPIDEAQGLVPGNVQLREDQRPRPLTLRMNVGDCLTIHFENLLAPTPVDNEQPATRTASVHVQGLQFVNGIADDGSFVGQNASSLVAPGESTSYTVFGEREGTYLFYSAAATTGGEGDGGSIARGLFGAVNVEPQGAVWYRSQLTRVEMDLATVKDASGVPITTPHGQPVVDYDAVYPAGHPDAGRPILHMLNDANEIVHGDLTAIIAGPPENGGRLPVQYPEVVVNRDRQEPFREFTVIFHDEIGIVQAFEIFDDPEFEHVLHSGRDAFAINYGTGGIGAEILGNRFGVGPMWDCNECKYEEFFLSSWSVGDPAMIVDVPANATDSITGELIEGPKATKVLYPDDPSNVYHSYLNDHVKFRNLHAGPKEHHIFHLHAHQWLHTPDGDNSTYLDSQALGPGETFTYEIAYNGGGNRPKTPGDAIFHCHFYPHFAQGMWALWRVHDVFRRGTPLDAEGRPVAGSLALPDGEIAAGTPTPGVVPLPGRPLALMPTDTFPGYPFYIPGIGGHRPPRPPLETVFDGGLPRHVVEDGLADFPAVNTLDFHKDNVEIDAIQLAEAGEADEQVAMNFHAKQDGHVTSRIDPATQAIVEDTFEVNGLPGVAGAPYADPCRADDGTATGFLRTYKAASIQLDAKHNKAGWHFPQHRMYGLWDDVLGFLNEQKPPEPLFFRANTGDCVKYHLVNLIPNEYDLDDFQVLTPTDVIGQHIHLVKFDVTSSDGAANGFNYEDGSYSPEEVVERIIAIRRFNDCTGLESGDPRDGTFECPVPEAHPFFGPTGPNGEDWRGAVETIQRWFTDDVLNAQGEDRTLRTVFTHDHFSPSTHQQAGLYAGLVAEPEGSMWKHNESGEAFYTRGDGGPTSWQAVIETADPDSSYREFNFQIADFGLAYEADNNGIPDPAAAINPPGRFEVGLPFLLAPPVDDACPNGDPPPCPELISADDPGAMLVNYRNEPLALRVRDPATNTQAPDPAGDLALAFASNVNRADDRLDVQPGFYPPLTVDLLGGDPFTPMMRAMEGDRVQVRMLIGAHEEGHNTSMHGTRWLFEPADSNSGFRNSQMMGISEHFEFDIKYIPGLSRKKKADFLFSAGSSTDDLWTGMWNLMRVYRNNANQLQLLPNNTDGKVNVANNADFAGVCPDGASLRTFDVTAVLAQDALPGGTLVYNPRTANGGPLHDPTAILYVRTSDLDASGQLEPGVPVEPLILRANAGDCVELTLNNALPTTGTPMPDLDGFNTLPMIINEFNANQVSPSRKVGLHAQLVEYDVTRSDGAAIGLNDHKPQLADPGKSVSYRWYAGRFTYTPNTGDDSLCIASTEMDSSTGTCGSSATGDLQLAHPVEYGIINLMPADRIQHSNKGAIGALVIEPEGADWATDTDTRAAATVTMADGSTHREFVALFQDDINLRFGSDFAPPAEVDPETGEVVADTFHTGDAVPNTAEAEDPEDSGQKAFNYATEPMWFRMGFAPNAPLGATREKDFTNVLSNAQVGGDPETPIFRAQVGDAVRFYVAHAGGHQRNHDFQVHGHQWQELPYVDGSDVIGDNPLSDWRGNQGGIGPTSHFDLPLQYGAGGPFDVTGDFLYRDFASFQFDGGLWGIFRVLSTMPLMQQDPSETTEGSPDGTVETSSTSSN